MKVICPMCANQNVIQDDDISGYIFSIQCENCAQLLSVKISVEALSVVQTKEQGQGSDKSSNRVTDYLMKNMATMNLPVLPILALKIREIRRDPDGNVKQVSEIVKSDQIIAQKILMVANSAKYGGIVEITDLNMAIVRLGLMVTETIVTALENKRIYKSKNKASEEVLEALWKHALGVALTAQTIAELKKYDNVEEIFTGGLLHDFGCILFLEALQNEDFGVDMSQMTPMEFLNVINEDQGKIGAAYLRQSGLPESLAMVAEMQADVPQEYSDNKLIQTVSLANTLCEKIGIGIVDDDSIQLELTEAAHVLGLSDLQLANLEVECEDLFSEIASMI